jgi:hypothetical protein
LRPKGQVAAEGHDWAEGQVEAEGQIAAKGHDEAKGQDGANGQVVAKKAIWFCCCCVYSLTKYFAIFAEMKGYFWNCNKLQSTWR